MWKKRKFNKKSASQNLKAILRASQLITILGYLYLKNKRIKTQNIEKKTGNNEIL